MKHQRLAEQRIPVILHSDGCSSLKALLINQSDAFEPNFETNCKKKLLPLVLAKVGKMQKFVARKLPEKKYSSQVKQRSKLWRRTGSYRKQEILDDIDNPQRACVYQGINVVKIKEYVNAVPNVKKWKDMFFWKQSTQVGNYQNSI